MASSAPHPARASAARAAAAAPDYPPLTAGGSHDRGRSKRDTLFILAYVFGVPLLLWSVLHLGLGWL